MDLIPVELSIITIAGQNMTDNKMDKARDGFDAIEYPLDFSFKAVCVKAADISTDDLQIVICDTIESVVGASAIKGVFSKESSAGKYVSVTTIVRLDNRHQLESVYKAISLLDVVKMTL